MPASLPGESSFAIKLACYLRQRKRQKKSVTMDKIIHGIIEYTVTLTRPLFSLVFFAPEGVGYYLVCKIHM